MPVSTQDSSLFHAHIHMKTKLINELALGPWSGFGFTTDIFFSITSMRTYDEKSFKNYNTNHSGT